MKILITGSEGRIGRKLFKSLEREGHRVWGLDLKRGEDILKMDFSPYAYMDVVIHLAAQTSVIDSVAKPKQDFRLNAEATLTMLEVARRYDWKFIYAASAGTSHNIVSPYGLSKKVGDMYCELWGQLYSFPTVSLGLANVYGHGMGGVLGVWLHQAESNGKIVIYGDGLQIRNFVHVRDVIGCFKDALTWSPGYYEIASWERITIEALAEKFVFMYNDATSSHISVTYDVSVREGEVKKQDPLQSHIPWTPITLDLGLSDMIATFVSRDQAPGDNFSGAPLD